MGTFLEHRAAFPEEELRQYSGRWVAFNDDCTAIIADGKTEEDVEASLVRAGMDPARVRFEYVASGDEEFQSPESPQCSSRIRAVS